MVRFGSDGYVKCQADLSSSKNSYSRYFLPEHLVLSSESFTLIKMSKSNHFSYKLILQSLQEGCNNTYGDEPTSRERG